MAEASSASTSAFKPSISSSDGRLRMRRESSANQTTLKSENEMIETNTSEDKQQQKSNDQKTTRTISPSFVPATIIDGSKLILHLAKHDQFVLDAACRILFASPNLKFDKQVAWQTTVTCTESENTVVIDANLMSHRFVPIPLAYFGTVYTKGGTVHVIVGNSVKRTKIYSRNLPYRACNKFHNQSVYNDNARINPTNTTKWHPDHHSTSEALGYVASEQAAKAVEMLSSDPHDGVLYFRSDDSLVRYRLKKNDRIALIGGSVVAWTLGVRFEMSSYCCFKTVNAAHGEGTIWVQNSRTVAGRSVGGGGY